VRRWLSNHSKALTAALLALFCAQLGVALLDPASVPGSALTRASYDSYFRWLRLAEGAPTNSPVVIVYLDLESHQREGQDPTRPWPRALHAQLLQRLRSAGARAVVLDFIFDTPGPDAAGTQALAKALADDGRVVLAGEITTSSRSTVAGQLARMTKLAMPIDSLRQAAASWGLGEVGVDDDFVPRQHFSGRTIDGEPRPSLTWAAGQLLGLDAVSVKSGADPSRWFHYYGPPFTLPHVSYSDALQPGLVADTFFRDRIVFVGARPIAGLFSDRRDEFRTPFRPWRELETQGFLWRERDLFMPGVEVHAMQMLNLLRGDWLRRPGVRALGGWFALAGVLLGAGLIWLRPVLAACAAFLAVGAVIASVAFLFRPSRIWFPWLIVVGTQVPAALGGSILYNSLEWYRTRRRLEAAKRAADARIHEQAALIAKAHDAILVRDLDGRITYVNPSAVRLFGWTLSELGDGQPPKLFLDPAAAEAQHAALARGEWNGELKQPARSGKVLTLESRWTLLRDEAGEPRGLLIISSDATERKQLEAEALRMQRMEAIGALAGGMAHDLNNALAPVLMGTQLLARDARDDNARRVLTLMEASTRRGADMVRQVLLFARGKSGDFERLDARPLVKDMEKLAHDTFPQNISVSAHVANDLWPVRGNPTQLHQVLLNLCVNARDAMPRGGALTLAADNVELTSSDAQAIAEARPGCFVVLMVSDTGAGIPPEILPRIFDPFFTTKPEGKGTGLGLSTTSRIVKAHEGFIQVLNQPGLGTTFEVYLPRHPEEGSEAVSATAEPLPRGHGELILVADDDEAARELLRRSLEDHGYRVLTAANGGEAVSAFKARSREVALVVSDFSMPVLDGVEAVKAMRKLYAGIPALILSGEARLTGGMDDGDGCQIECLPKPVELPTLLRVIARALSKG